MEGVIELMTSPEYIYSELPAIELFQQLGYKYKNGGSWEERQDITEVILEDRLRNAIKKINNWGISNNNVEKAMHRLTAIHSSSLMETNQKAWELIQGANFSVKQVINGKEEYKSASFIDYLHPENNDFLVVNQMKFHGRLKNSIPDLIVYVNGIPIAVIECKAPGAPNAFDKAYEDLKYYQENSEKLFW